MNSLKTLLGATLLAALAYGVYVGITKKPVETSHVDGPKIEPGVSTKDDVPPLPVVRTDESAADATEDAPTFAPGLPADAPTTAEAAPPDEHGYADAPSYEDGPPPPVTADAVAVTEPPASAETPSGGITPVSATAPAMEPSVYAQMMPAVEQMLQANQLAEAHLALSKLYGHASLTQEEHARVTELLSQLAGTVIYSRQHLLEPPHRVAQGESLEQIATTYQVPWQLLAKINGISSGIPQQPLPAGQDLKVVRGPFHAVVDLDDRQLVLFLQGERYAGRFPIAIGTDNPPQPDAHYVVRNKLVHPSYFYEKVFVPEDPANPLGSRKIELDQGVCIHGTNDDTSLDREDPRGCIRLKEHDIADVYDILTVGSEVAVRR